MKHLTKITDYKVDIEKLKSFRNPIELSSSAEVLLNANFFTSLSKKVKDANP